MNQNNCFRVTRIAIHLLVQQKKFNYGKKLFFSDQLEILILTEFSEKPSFQKNIFCLFRLFFGKLNVYLHPNFFPVMAPNCYFRSVSRKLNFPQT